MILKIILGAYFLLCILFGFFYCFNGYRWLRKILGFFGFIVGAAVGFFLFTDMTIVLHIVLTLVFAIAFALLFRLLYKIGMFFTGASLGGIIGYALCQALKFNMAETVPIIIVCAFALGFGVLTLIFSRFFIIVSTSFVGSSVVALNVLTIVTGYNTLFVNTPDLAVIFDKVEAVIQNVNANYSTPLLIATLLLGIIGMIIQFNKSKKQKSNV